MYINLLLLLRNIEIRKKENKVAPLTTGEWGSKRENGKSHVYFISSFFSSEAAIHRFQCSRISFLNQTSISFVIALGIFKFHSQLEAQLWSSVTSLHHCFYLREMKKYGKQLNLNHEPSIKSRRSATNASPELVVLMAFAPQVGRLTKTYLIRLNNYAMIR